VTKLGIWRQKLGGAHIPTLATGMMLRLLPSLIISLHEFGAMFTCLPIVVHVDPHTREIIIIVFCKQSSNLLAEPSLSIIPCYVRRV
jgi:hypothetical protein